jgi:hypothetical protein
MERACTELVYPEYIEGKCSRTIDKKGLIKAHSRAAGLRRFDPFVYLDRLFDIIKL